MFGKIIKELRKQWGLTQLQFGEKIGLAESTISLYENSNRQPDFETLIKIANYFDVSTDFLLGRTNVRKQMDSNDVETLQFLSLLDRLNAEGKKNAFQYLTFLASSEDLKK